MIGKGILHFAATAATPTFSRALSGWQSRAQELKISERSKLQLDVTEQMAKQKCKLYLEAKPASPQHEVSFLLFFAGRMQHSQIGSIYGAASPTPPPLVDGSWSPPPLWLWGCGGALLVSDAADFLWFLVPPPPLWMFGWVMVVVAVLEVCI